MPKDEFDPEDPLELCGIGILSTEDTTLEMTDCFIEEFMRLGYNHKQLLAIFRNPNYTGMNMVLQNRGEQFVRERISEIFAVWNRPFSWGAQPAAPPSELSAPLIPAEPLPSDPGDSSQPRPLDPMGGEIPLELVHKS